MSDIITKPNVCNETIPTVLVCESHNDKYNQNFVVIFSLSCLSDIWPKQIMYTKP